MLRAHTPALYISCMREASLHTVRVHVCVCNITVALPPHLSSSSSAIFRCPRAHASISGVRSALSLLLTLAACFTRSSLTSKLFFLLDQCRREEPFTGSVAVVTLAPHWSRYTNSCIVRGEEGFETDGTYENVGKRGKNVVCNGTWGTLYVYCKMSCVCVLMQSVHV